MPNWIENKIKIYGDEIFLKEIQNTQFEFSKIKPEPERIRYIAELHSNLQDKLVSQWKGKVTPEIKKIENDLIKWKDEFETNNLWYEKNWNGEYHAYEIDFSWITNNILLVNFLTRWRPPREILKHLSKTYPVKIKHNAFDHVNTDEFCFEYEQGKIISQKFIEGGLYWMSEEKWKELK